MSVHISIIHNSQCDLKVNIKSNNIRWVFIHKRFRPILLLLVNKTILYCGYPNKSNQHLIKQTLSATPIISHDILATIKQLITMRQKWINILPIINKLLILTYNDNNYQLYINMEKDSNVYDYNNNNLRYDSNDKCHMKICRLLYTHLLKDIIKIVHKYVL